MIRPAAARFVRAAARLAAAFYPRRFRDEFGGVFPDAAEDRFNRERRAGASPTRAALVTVRILAADTVAGRRLARRLVVPRPRRRLPVIDHLRADVRFACRGLARAPFLTLVATLSLAIGIGANAAIFTVVNALLVLPPAGIGDPSRVVDIGRAIAGGDLDTVSYPTYEDFRDRTTTLTGVYALRPEPGPVSVDGPTGATLAFTHQVSTTFFDVLGVAPAVGAFFHGANDRSDPRARTVVLSHAYWTRHFDADRNVVGRPLILDGDEFTIVGVAPEGFQGTTILAPDLWVPLTAGSRATPTENFLRSRESAGLLMGGRLKPGVTLERARAEAAAFSASMARAFPEIADATRLRVEPVNRTSMGRVVVGPFVAVLMALVGLVLCAACANLGGLLVARGAGRAREISVRLALGASRRTLVRMFLVEVVLLFAPGAALAFLVARGIIGILEALIPQLPVPVSVHFGFDARVIVFTLAVALVSALVTGLAPALQATRPGLIADLKSDSSAPRRQRFRRGFVIAQVALCVLLLALAGLFGRALQAASGVDPGLIVDRVDVAGVDFGLAGYAQEQWTDATARLRERLQAIPGVTNVAVAAVVPLSGNGLGLGSLRRPGDRSSEPLGQADWNVVSPDFLPALGVPIVRGRNFTSGDRAGAPLVAIVNERFARTMWPNADPVGRVLESGDFRPGRPTSDIQRLTVVGITKDTKYRSLGDVPRSFIFVPVEQTPWRRPSFFLTRAGRLDRSFSLEPAVRRTLAEFDRHLPLIEMLPFTQYANWALVPQRIGTVVAGSLGGLALLLAAIGIYGLMAFLVSSRTREIGVRIALGADPRAVMRLVLRQGVRLSLAGGLVGLGAALFGAPILRDFLFGISPADPMALAGTAAAVAAAAGLAIVVPARRATRVDPVVALRAE